MCLYNEYLYNFKIYFKKLINFLTNLINVIRKNLINN